MEEIYEPAEDSFLLESCLSAYSGKRALDMGTGSGILARTLVKSFREVTAVDVNPAAASHVELIKNCEFVESDLFAEVKGRFDLIVFNPPYLQDEGDLRYAAGEKGELLMRFFGEAKRHLSKGGKIVFLLSSISPIGKKEIEKMGYKVRKLAEKKVAWEMLTAYEAS